MPRRPSSREIDRSEYERKFDLGALFDFSTIINASLDLKFIFGHLLLTIMGKLLSVRGMVLLHEEKSIFRVESVRGLPQDMLAQKFVLPALPNRLIYLSKENAKKHSWVSVFREHGISVIAPLSARDHILGVVCFTPGRMTQRLGHTEETYVKSLANIAAGAIEKGLVVDELHQVNRRLDRKIQELKTLFELSKEFNGVLTTDQLVKLLLFSIMGQIGATRYLIALKRKGTMDIIASRLSEKLPESTNEFFLRVTSPVLVEDLTKKRDQALRLQLQEAGIEAVIPLQVQNATMGILAVGGKLHGGRYSAGDVEFLLSLGNLAIIAMENARLFNEAIERQKLEDELVIAREIQRALLPAKLPDVPGFDLSAVNISSKQVGGDYYDVIALDRHRYMVAIGDVSGKGAPASLLMANLQATIRALIPMELSLGELTTRVNDLICDNTTSGRFITFFWLILDVESRTFQYVNAGHNPPMLFRHGGSIERLFSGGIILGIVRSPKPYEEGIVTLQRGDLLVLFTDGVTEAMNGKGEELGEGPLEKVCSANVQSTAQDVVDSIISTVQSHSSGSPQSDDVTLVALKVL